MGSFSFVRGNPSVFSFPTEKNQCDKSMILERSTQSQNKVKNVHTRLNSNYQELPLIIARFL